MKNTQDFQPGDAIVILDAIDASRDYPRLCKVKQVTPAGGIIGEDIIGRRWFAPRPDRYYVPDLFHPLTYEER